jgi:hypothetical protein
MKNKKDRNTSALIRHEGPLLKLDDWKSDDGKSQEHDFGTARTTSHTAKTQRHKLLSLQDTMVVSVMCGEFACSAEGSENFDGWMCQPNSLEVSTMFPD